MGVLHGGAGSDCTKEKLMYFNNIKHESYQKLFTEYKEIDDAIKANLEGVPKK